MNNQLLPQLQEIFRSIFENPSLELTSTTSAKEIPNWDSMNHVSLISEIESYFDVEFDLDDLIEMNNVASILNSLSIKLENKI
jgi:acyl carrier protein